MSLSNDLISQFAKITKDEDTTKKESTVYGTIVNYNGSNKYVRLDGSELVTPIITTVDVVPDERVIVMIKNHTATVTGNISSPAARLVGVKEDIDAEKLRIDSLELNNADIENLSANYAELKKLIADKASITELQTMFATIDLVNISKASMANFYAKSGLIQNVVIGSGTITGELVGVTINGDLIKAGTLVADKLIVQGQNGLYYKLNTDGNTVETEQTDYNSLNGSVILAKSITATKINVEDLVAFGATIGGFNITSNSLYSGVKETIDNTTRGIYLDDTGQIAIGDSNNYIKYFKDTDESYKLLIGVNGADLSDASKTATDYLNLSSAGLVVGQNPNNPTAGNTLISTDGVSIRKGTTVLAAFKAASRTTSGISSITLTSTDSTDSESDGTTRVSGTVSRNETRANIYITTNGNPVYFQKGLETDKVLINNSGIITNANILLDGSLVDHSGEGILTPLNSYGNMVIGYGRYQDGGGTHVYGTFVKAKTKSGFSASVNGKTAIDTNNSSGNATFGWHLYDTNVGETNIYGKITSLFSKDDIRLSANGNSIRFEGNLVPYSSNEYNLGTASLPLHNIYIACVNDGTTHGLRFGNSDGSYNAVGMNASGYLIYGNSEVCTNIITKSTTTSSTGYSFKITCGDNSSLTVDDNDARLLLYGGTDSTSRYLGSMAVYKRTYTSAANMYVTTNGMMGRSTSSSRRYKKDIVDLTLDTVSGLYELPVRQFKYKDEHLSTADERYGLDMPGFIAEEVAEYLPIACDHITNKDGKAVPEMWNSKIIIPSLLKLIQDLNSRLKAIEEKEVIIQNG